MIRKLKSGEYRLCPHAKDPGAGRRRNPGISVTREAAALVAPGRAVPYFKRH